MSVVHVVSVSSGKDSDATLLIALNRYGKDRVRAVMCDTGNEHELAWAHIAYLEARLGIKVTVLRADFTAELAAKRMFIARDVRTRRQYKKSPKFDRDGNPVWKKDKAGNLVVEPVLDESQPEGFRVVDMKPVQAVGYDGGRKVRWTNKAKRRALAEMHPSGNPFLDLCMWKGCFPSRKAQFCTEELKTALLVQYQQDLVEAGHRVVSWQGVRRDESHNRRNAKEFERLQPRTYAYRPLFDRTAAWVFDYLKRQDIRPNELYYQGANRVGCMPCINCGKDELRNIAQRWPEHPERIAEWERKVGACSKRGFSTFMADAHPAKDRRQVFADLNIWTRIEWSKTTRGGKQYDLLGDDEPAACASSHGLCE